MSRVQDDLPKISVSGPSFFLSELKVTSGASSLLPLCRWIRILLSRANSRCADCERNV